MSSLLQLPSEEIDEILGMARVKWQSDFPEDCSLFLSSPVLLQDFFTLSEADTIVKDESDCVTRIELEDRLEMLTSTELCGRGFRSPTPCDDAGVEESDKEDPGFNLDAAPVANTFNGLCSLGDN